MYPTVLSSGSSFDGFVLPKMSSLPGTFFGKKIVWDGDYKALPVHVDDFQIPGACDQYHLFGYRYQTGFASFLESGRRLPEGFFVEYLVVASDMGRVKETFSLKQGMGIVYAPEGVRTETLDVEKLEKDVVRNQSYLKVPAWSSGVSVWPFVDGVPMSFVKQVYLPRNHVTENALTWDKNLYIFHVQLGAKSEFRLIAQEAREQSIEEHYDSE